MGVRIESGTITLNISEMELSDADGYDQAVGEIRSAVEGAIANGCSTYSQSLSLADIELDEWDVMSRVAEVKLRATVTVHVEYGPETTQPDTWAEDQGWNFLAFHASDVDFDYEVEDSDSGQSADVDADDTVEDPRDFEVRLRQRAQDAHHQANAEVRRLKDIIDRVNRFGASDLPSYYDPEFAHTMALDEDRKRYDVSHIAAVTEREGVEGLRGLTDDEIRAKAAGYGDRPSA